MNEHWVNILVVITALGTLVGPMAAARTVEFETSEVTQAHVSVSPDGQWLIFGILGHLFRLPVAGGTAEQLTFGPFYDVEPMFLPDGRHVAFISDRDGDKKNVFTLDLDDGQITQLTHEPWVGRATCAPDGLAIIYMARETAMTIRRVDVRTRKTETIHAVPRGLRSVFYLTDGRLGWAVDEGEQTHFKAMTAQGSVTTLRTVEGEVRSVATSPAGDGLYCRRNVERPGLDSVELVFISLPTGEEKLLIPLEDRAPHFSIGSDGKELYFGDSGRLWRYALASGVRTEISFRARVSLDVQDAVAPRKWTPPPVGGSFQPRSIMSPRLSPDGQTLVFGAAGYLWQQSVNGGPASRLFLGNGFEWYPAFSPDGRYLAYVRSEYGMEEVRLFDFQTRQSRSLASGYRYSQPSWTPDGKRLVFAQHWWFEQPQMVSVSIGDGKMEILGQGARKWAPRPHFSGDGHSLYFTTTLNGTGTLSRMPLSGDAKPEPVTQLDQHLSDGLVSHDGKWLAFRRNSEVWVATLGSEPVKEKDIHRLSTKGGTSFAFTPDCSAVIYSSGNRVWRHPLARGQREEIPIRLELPRPKAPPLLLRRVRILDFAKGDFSSETSVYIDQGRIRWIGPEQGRKITKEMHVIDARGRFAIPGLSDLHMHLWGTTEALLAYGVTLVRDVGGRLAELNALADRGEATRGLVPRFFFAGEWFEGAQPFLGDISLHIHDEDEARKYVRRWKERGAHFIKAYFTLPWALQSVVAAEAHREGLYVVGHGISVKPITKSVTLGYACVEHISYRLYDDVLGMMAAAGTRWDPTLVVGSVGEAGHDILLVDEPERLLNDKFRSFTPERYVRLTQRRRPHKRVLEWQRQTWIERLASIRAAYRLGVKLQAGTDPPVRLQGRGAAISFFGSSLHWELEHLVEAGLPPLEVLRIATQESAAAVGAGDHLGTLEAGKLADLVLLDANPLENIRNTETIWRVIKDGWLFDPDKLRPTTH